MALQQLLNPDQHEIHLAFIELGITHTIPTPHANTYFGVAAVPGFPNRGLGCIAIRPITRGTRILEESPLLEVPHFANAFAPFNATRINQAVANLAPNDLQDFNNLSYSRAPPSYQARYSNNAVGTDRGGTRLQAIFIQASRFNHSCVPNAYFTWSLTVGQQGNQGRLTVHVMQDIAMHEEIVVNYFFDSCVNSRRRRQAELTRVYGFTCDCRACDIQAPSATYSETHRGWIRGIDTELAINRGAARNRRENMILLAQRRIDFLKVENIVYPNLANAHRQLAELYLGEMTIATPLVIDRGEARRKGLEAAREELKLDLLCTGWDSAETQDTLALIRRLG